MTSCRTFAGDLGPFVDGALNGRRRALVARHLEACADCAREADAIRTLGQTLREGTAAQPDQEAFDGLAGGVVGRIRAESAASWRDWFARASQDWHWPIVAAGSLSATAVTTIVLLLILGFGPKPEREDSLLALINNLGSPPGMLFVYVTQGEGGQPATLVQVENGQPTASRMTVALAAMAYRTQSEAELVDAMATAVVGVGGRIVPLAVMRPEEREHAEALLTELSPTRALRPIGPWRVVSVHEVRLLTSLDVRAKGL